MPATVTHRAADVRRLLCAAGLVTVATAGCDRPRDPVAPTRTAPAADRATAGVAATARSDVASTTTAAPAAPDGAPGPTGPGPGHDRSARDSAITRLRLEQVAAGLLYTSESDYPFDYVHFPAGIRTLTPAAFRIAAGVPGDSLVEERTLDEFLARHIERVDPADAAAVALVPRYVALRHTLRTALRGVRVFRVGRIAIRCYLVGLDRRGDVVGLATTAIET